MSKAERTKQLIIEKASIVLNERGIAGTSVDDILKASRTAKASFYSYFNSKEELCYACADYLFEQLSQKRDHYISKQDTAKAKILSVMEMSKNPLNFMIDGGCPIINFSTEADDTNKLIVKKLRTIIRSTISLYTEILQNGIRSGEFSTHLHAEEFAMKMFTCLEGAIAICRVMNSTKPMRLVINNLKYELDHYSIL